MAAPRRRRGGGRRRGSGGGAEVQFEILRRVAGATTPVICVLSSLYRRHDGPLSAGKESNIPWICRERPGARNVQVTP